MMLESANCPACGAEGKAVFTQRDLLLGIPGEFGQRSCAGCGGFFLSPRVPETDIGRYYPDSYEPYQAAAPSDLVFRVAAIFGLPFRRQRIVERFVPGGRLLDVGCGSGEFLRLLDGARWQRFATDIERHCPLDLPVEFHAGLFDRDRLPLANLDAITLWHVFEHFYHPRKALEHAGALLKPGGFLFLAIPDLACIERVLFRRCWIGWDPPRHIATYSKKGIELLLRESGLRLVSVVPDNCTGDLLALNIEFVLRTLGWKLNLHHSTAVRILLSPFMFVLRRVGLAPTKVYVAQK